MGVLVVYAGRTIAWGQRCDGASRTLGKCVVVDAISKIQQNEMHWISVLFKPSAITMHEHELLQWLHVICITQCWLKVAANMEICNIRNSLNFIQRDPIFCYFLLRFVFLSGMDCDLSHRVIHEISSFLNCALCTDVVIGYRVKYSYSNIFQNSSSWKHIKTSLSLFLFLAF